MKLFGKEAKILGPVHFIGVGGIGMVGLAEILARWGVKVTGSDLSLDYTRQLDDLKVKLFSGHDAANVGDAKLVVVSTAIKADNPELLDARARGLPVVHRAEMLAEIMKNYQAIAVAGTHGKTSTTAMAYAGLRAAGMPVGVIDGGILNDVGSTVVLPPKAGDWLVVEADESDASFLKLPVKVAVVTNIEAEHMDTYGGKEEKLLAAFVEFMDKAEAAVVCGDSPNAMIAGATTTADVVTYGLEDSNDVYAKMYAPQGRGMAFDAVVRGGVLDDVVVAMPGVHYVSNALAVLGLASLLKADITLAAEGLAKFAGVGRRFSFAGHLFGNKDGAEVVDDYGHHPTEIAATLDAAKSVYPGRVVAVIEPHRYTRVRDLMAEFADCAKVADECVILPIYAAGEKPIPGITQEALAAKIAQPVARVAADDDDLKAVLKSMKLGAGDAVVVLGAGRSSKVAKLLVK